MTIELGLAEKAFATGRAREVSFSRLIVCLKFANNYRYQDPISSDNKFECTFFLQLELIEELSGEPKA